MERVDLWGYTIYSNGKIVGLHGKELAKNKQIKVKWGVNGKTRMVSRARFVYYAFNYKNFNFNDKTIVIKHINGKDDDCGIQNLTTIKRKFINQGQYNSSAKLTDEQVKEIKELYGKKRMYRKVNNKKVNKNDPMTNISYRKLAEKYGVSHSMIAGIVKGQFRNEDNYIIK